MATGNHSDNRHLNMMMQYLGKKFNALGDPVETTKCEAMVRMQDLNYDIRCVLTYVEPNGRRNQLFCSRTVSFREFREGAGQENMMVMMDDMYNYLVQTLWDKIANFEVPSPPPQPAIGGLSGTHSGAQVFSDDFTYTRIP